MPYIVKDYFQKKAIEECKGEFSEEYEALQKEKEKFQKEKHN